jgi:maltose phosphorylase
MSIVYGFGGMRIKNGALHFTPKLPENWKSLTFKIDFRNNILNVCFDQNGVSASKSGSTDLDLFINNEKLNLVKDILK